MGKYTSASRKADAPVRNREVHPVMRGIGCIMFVVVPILSYGLAVGLVNFAISRNFPLPPSWLGNPTFHPLLWKVSGLAYLLGFLQYQVNLTANLIFAAVITLGIGSVMSVIYGYIYNLFGPSPYGPTDVPPVRVKVKRYKR